MNTDRIDQVLADFMTKYNCCQSIVITYGKEYLGSKKKAIQLGTGFGGGIGGHGLVCGAVTGAIMVISLKYGMKKYTDTEKKEKTYEIITKFIDRFTSAHGTIFCNDLLGCDINSTKGQEIIRDKNLFQIRCPKFERTAAELLEELL
jgi:C_GCAxxG_C_C family probable redox protein